MANASNIIDFDKLCTEYEPIVIPYKGEQYTIDAFDASVMKRMSDAAMASAKDNSKTAHDSSAAQINAVTGIPLELLANEDFRNVKKMLRAITDAIFKAGEDEATKKA